MRQVGRGPLPRLHETVLHMLADRAARAPSAPALVCGEDRLSYAEYLSCVAGFRSELRDHAVEGTCVALLLRNSVTHAIAHFAIYAAGAQLVPLNPSYTAHELEPILSDAAPALIVAEADLSALVDPLARKLGIGPVIYLSPERRLTAWRSQGAQLPPGLPTADDLAILQYTGGTTGRAKGVELSHRALSTNVSQREALLPTEPEHDRALAVTPLFHSYAMAMGLFLSAYCRGTLVILPRYHPELVFETIARERITLLLGSPTIYTGLLSHDAFRTADLRSLRLCYSGSSALPEETLRRWEEATGCPICEGYGQTEAGPVLTFNPQDGPRKPGSVGVPCPATEIEIVDVETGTRALAVGERGEIRARGPQIMRGYRKRPEATAQALRGGWLYTGDIGEFDADGYLYIRDRKKEMVIVAGYNVYPREVEEVLYGHPAVLEAAVIGVGDAYRGEAVKAFVAPRPGAVLTAEALIAFCAERLARYKVPSTVVLTDALPKTTVGKIDKKRIRELEADASAES